MTGRERKSRVKKEDDVLLLLLSGLKNARFDLNLPSHIYVEYLVFNTMIMMMIRIFLLIQDFPFIFTSTILQKRPTVTCDSVHTAFSQKHDRTHVTR